MKLKKRNVRLMMERQKKKMKLEFQRILNLSTLSFRKETLRKKY